jgi:hypothetical protein
MAWVQTHLFLGLAQGGGYGVLVLCIRFTAGKGDLASMAAQSGSSQRQ